MNEAETTIKKKLRQLKMKFFLLKLKMIWNVFNMISY